MENMSPPIRLREIFSVENLSKIYLEILLENLSDSHHMRFSQHSAKGHTLRTSQVFIDELLERGGRYFQILDHSGHDFLGSVTIRPQKTLECEAGILVFKSAAGRGIGSAVWMELPNIVKTAGYERLVAGCHRDNLAMRALMRKLGMSQLSSLEPQSKADLQEPNVYFTLDLANFANTQI